MVYYFAYGSNMDAAQMRERCPSARAVGIARFPDHRLAFTRMATTRRCGVADAVPSPGDDVWGVVYEVEAGELAYLDECEGVDVGAYVREARAVRLKATGGEEVVKAEVYFVRERAAREFKTNAAYKTILLAAAGYWDLPASYVEALEDLETA